MEKDRDERLDRLLEKVKRGEVTRRQFLSLAGGVVGSVAATALLAACGPAETPTAPPEASPAAPEETPAPPKKSRIVVGLGGEPASLDRNQEENALGFSIYPAIYGYLTKADPEIGDIIPALATEWTQIDDLTLEMKLREGVKFHNGEDFDSQAVQDSIMRVVTSDPVAAVYSKIKLVDRVDVVDKYTVRVHSESPFVVLLAGLTMVCMYPSEYHERVGQREFAAAPVGTGPWKLKEWNRGVSITLEKFDDYWGPKAEIDEVVWQFYPEAATRMAALETGEIDVAANVPPDDIERLKGEGLEIAWTPIGQGMGLWIIPRRDERLEDKRIRQALNYGVDKDELVNELMLGYTRKLDGQVMGPDCFGYNPDLESYPYDPQMAKDLLADAGYPDGITIKMHSSTGRYAKQKEVSEALVGQLAKVGVTVELEMIEWASLEHKVLSTLDTHPLYYWGWNYYPAMDADFCLQHFICDSPFKSFCDPSGEMDRVFAESRIATDREERRRLLQEFAALMREEAPGIFLFQSPDIWGVNPRLKDVKPSPENAIYLFDAYVTD